MLINKSFTFEAQLLNRLPMSRINFNIKDVRANDFLLYLDQAMRKRVFAHMWIARAQISLLICTVWSGHSLSSSRITGYQTMYKWRAKARMILCASAEFSECSFCTCSEALFFAWRGPLYFLQEITDMDHTKYFGYWPHLVSRTMTVARTLVDPVLYLIFSEKFQRALIALVTCRWKQIWK